MKIKKMGNTNKILIKTRRKFKLIGLPFSDCLDKILISTTSRDHLEELEEKIVVEYWVRSVRKEVIEMPKRPPKYRLIINTWGDARKNFDLWIWKMRKSGYRVFIGLTDHRAIIR